MRLPTFHELNRFVEVEGWEDKDRKSGKKKGDHHRYVFTTPNGARLYTRISHGKGQINNSDFFAHILCDQLDIDVIQFWSAVDDGVIPIRQSPTSTHIKEALDAKLVRNLITKVKISPIELESMTKQQAISLWQEWLISNNPQEG